MNPRSPYFVTTVLSITVLASICGCAPEPKTPEPAPPASAAVSSPGRWVKVRVAQDLTLLELPARVVGPAEASGVVAASLRAKVLRAHVRVGQRVEKGAPILDVVVPELLHAAATVSSVDVRLASVERRLGELTALKAEGLARAEVLFDLENRRAELSAERTLAHATLDSAGLGALDPKELVARGWLTLRSPAAGVVSALSAVPGEVREPGGAPFARITGEGVGRVEAALVRPLPAATAVDFVTPSGERWRLDPKPVAEVIDPDDGARTAWFELAAPSPLPGGLRGRIVVQPEAKGALEVPAEAIRERDGQTFVLRRTGTGGDQQPVPVVVTVRSGATALVEPGPSPGAAIEPRAGAQPRARPALLAEGDEVLAATGEGEG